MISQLQLGDVVVDVVQKDIKNLHLSVHPPTGRVTIAAPLRMKPEAVRVFAIIKLGWIKQQQLKQQAQPRETPRDYVEKESHYFWGRRYLMTIIEEDCPPRIDVSGNKIKLHMRPGTPPAKRQAIMEGWYRDELKKALPPLLANWERKLGVKVSKVFVQRMKTKWGSCNHRARHVRLNSELAKKPKKLLDYVIVHELAHLLEPTHNQRFGALLDHHYPSWREVRAQLNELPLASESWGTV
jgi:predicted metal-dependent hydrolase